MIYYSRTSEIPFRRLTNIEDDLNLRNRITSLKIAKDDP